MPDSPGKPAFKPRTVRCPRCGGDSLYSADNPYRPFCSATCKNIDFGAWASEAYRVEAAPDPNDPDAPPPEDAPHPGGGLTH
jgi:endogenous inhibitor of DNA gyrase (YacG/DUF329 family)